MTRLDWRAAFVLLALTWGSSFAFIAIALRDLGPLEVAFARCLLGALTLLGLVAALRDQLPRGREVWAHLFVVALLFNSVPFVLLGLGQERISSSLTGLTNATVPLMTALFTLALLPGDRPTPLRTAGLGLGFAGVVVVLGPWNGLGGSSLTGQLFVLGATACYGLAFVYTRRFVAHRDDSGLALSAAQLVWATGQLLVATLLLGTAPDGLGAGPVLALLGLGCLGTGIAYVLNFHVVREAGVTTASTVTYLVPVVSTLLGVLALGDDLVWNEPVGAAVVLTGVAISARAAARVPAPAPARGS